MIANIVVELPYQTFSAIIIWACFYYAVIGIQSSDRQVLVLLFCIQLMLYGSTFANMTIAAMPDAQTASSVVVLLVLMSLTFCGVLQAPSALPGFWIFMYRVSPFTYWVGGMVATQLHDRPIVCSADETNIFNPPSGETCGTYMAPFLAQAPGQLQNPDANESCRYCPLTVADQYFAGSDIYWSQRWRNFGIMWAYIIFNVYIAVLTYYLFRVRKWGHRALGGKDGQIDVLEEGPQGVVRGWASGRRVFLALEPIQFVPMLVYQFNIPTSLSSQAGWLAKDEGPWPRWYRSISTSYRCRSWSPCRQKSHCQDENDCNKPEGSIAPQVLRRCQAESDPIVAGRVSRVCIAFRTTRLLPSARCFLPTVGSLLLPARHMRKVGLCRKCSMVSRIHGPAEVRWQGLSLGLRYLWRMAGTASVQDGYCESPCALDGSILIIIHVNHVNSPSSLGARPSVGSQRPPPPRRWYCRGP